MTLPRLSLIAALLLLALPAWANADGPDFFRVPGQASDQALSMHAGPSGGDRQLGRIPAGTDHLRNLGCIDGMSDAERAVATGAEKRAALLRRWCKIRYRGVDGWVFAGALVEGSPPPAPPKPGDPQGKLGSAWRLIAMPGHGRVRAEAWIAFSDSGSIWGNTGCNFLRGSVKISGTAFKLAGGLAVTRRACPGALDAQERWLVKALETARRVSFDPLTGQLRLGPERGSATLVLDRDPERWR
ncbi:heat shock protein HslJ [Rhodovulum iodosum]|uniref:Heat shock protein HslJ n=1 Tax=Rhodovulum iodosum TaxID=68291 RepID=A0ABV3XVU4_9RHOB|nr:META domain-containing protein [Rhodovulum robiginosum]RSK33639.1 META domain-containing protein [Rhodovulum robiginosum]